MRKDKAMMNIVFSNSYYQVFEYPDIDAIELVDNVRATGMILRGDMAQSFRESVAELLADEPSDEKMEAMLSSYDALMTVPVITH